jgi:hypothetical protein
MLHSRTRAADRHPNVLQDVRTAQPPTEAGEVDGPVVVRRHPDVPVAARLNEAADQPEPLVLVQEVAHRVQPPRALPIRRRFVRWRRIVGDARRSVREPAQAPTEAFAVRRTSRFTDGRGHAKARDRAVRNCVRQYSADCL